MELLIFFLALVWGIRICINTVSYAQLWWVKEYRWDRMLIHLGTPQGKRFWLPPLRWPPVSPKSTLLVLLSFVMSGYIVSAIKLPILLRMALADALSFPMTWIFVLLLNAPTRMYHFVLIALAVRKLRSHRPMTIIGVTGSYGKTSVKDYLATILSSKFRVLKTEASKNSPIAIAEVILVRLKPDDEVFVVEMGAYKRGEIAEMVRMVKPEIGIVTAINAQHQDLFGSVENTMKAKYELIAGLTGRRITIMNMDDARLRTMVEWAKDDGCDVWERRFTAKDVKAGFWGIEFTCHFRKEKAKVKARVVGGHQEMNILLAIAGAVAAGMTFKDAADAARAIRPAPRVFEVISGVNGAIFINDTFNNNPDAAHAALDVLAWGKGKKILVFQPMIELGSYAQVSHEAVGSYAGKICDEIILTNRTYYESFIRGVRKVSQRVNVSVMSSEKAAAVIRSLSKKGDVVLFKGKEAEHVLKAI